MRYLLGVLMLWGFVAVFVFMDRLPLERGLLGLAWVTVFLLRRSLEDVAVQKRLHRLRRWWGRTKWEIKLGAQAAFFRRQENLEKYTAISEGLSEEQVRAWISDEMQNEMARYGFAVDYRFLTEPDEIQEHVKKLAIIIQKNAHFFLFIKVAWMPEWFQKSYMDRVIKSLMKEIANHYGEFLAKERARDVCAPQSDSCVFYPQTIKATWMNVDFSHTFCPETVIRQIARHEARHCAQYHALRRKGGTELVMRVIRHKEGVPYGEDILEYDAYRCQLGENRSIDEFLEEALIEVEWPEQQ